VGARRKPAPPGAAPPGGGARAGGGRASGASARRAALAAARPAPAPTRSGAPASRPGRRRGAHTTPRARGSPRSRPRGSPAPPPTWLKMSWSRLMTGMSESPSTSWSGSSMVAGGAARRGAARRGAWVSAARGPRGFGSAQGGGFNGIAARRRGAARHGGGAGRRRGRGESGCEPPRGRAARAHGACRDAAPRARSRRAPPVWRGSPPAPSATRSKSRPPRAARATPGASPPCGGQTERWGSARAVLASAAEAWVVGQRAPLAVVRPAAAALGSPPRPPPLTPTRGSRAASAIPHWFWPRSARDTAMEGVDAGVLKGAALVTATYLVVYA
jgi:hypothetical protein